MALCRTVSLGAYSSQRGQDSLESVYREVRTHWNQFTERSGLTGISLQRGQDSLESVYREVRTHWHQFTERSGLTGISLQRGQDSLESVQEFLQILQLKCSRETVFSNAMVRS